MLSNTTSAPDTFNSTLTVSARSTGAVYLAHQGTGNAFNGDVTFSTGNVFSNTYGTAAYNGNITLNSASANISFGNSTGTWTLASGKNISIGTFSAGTLTIRNLTQSDNSVNMRLALTGTGKLVLGNNSISAKLYASSNQLTFSATRFLNADTLIYTGGNNATSAGGNYFGSTVYIANTYTGTNYHFTLGSSSVDTFTTTTTIATTGNTSLDVANGLFLGAVTLRNSSTGTLSDRLFIWDCTFKGALTLDGIHSAIKFKNGTGNSLIDSSATLSLVSGYAGQLTLSYIEQRGSNAINLNMSTNTSTGNNTILTIGPNAIFNANFLYLGQRLELNGGTFNGSASFTRFSQQLDVCEGGNVFNGVTQICDSVAATTANRVFKLANTTADDFNGNVTFKQYGTGSSASTMKMYPAYTANSTFAGNVTVESNNVQIEFGANGGKVILDGSGTQSLSKTGSYIPSFKRIQVNKSSGIVSLVYPLTLADTLFLTKGVFATDSINLLTVPDNAIVSGGSDLAFISGPLKKIGNDAFSFTLGDTAEHTTPYHPLSITAPSSTSDEFIAQYYAHGSMAADSRDSVHFSGCENWTLKHDAGSSKVKVSLGWNANSCWVADTSRMVVEVNNGSSWSSHGKASINKNEDSGTIISSDSVYIPSSSKYSLMIYNVGPCGSFYQVPSFSGAFNSTAVLADYGLQYGFTSTVVWIGQDFIIDGSHGNPSEVIFDNCQTRSEPGIEIQVPAGQTLKVKNLSTLTSCTDLWGGVRLADVTSTVHIEGASTIENATVGITTLNGGIIESDGVLTAPNVFHDNIVDVHLEGSTLNPYPGYIRGTDFTSTFVVDYVTNIAIDIVNSRWVTIGDEAQANYRNRFTGFNMNAIRATLSDLCVENCEIDLLNRRGIAIFSQFGNNDPASPINLLNVGTSGFTNSTTTYSRNTIRNVNNGIRSIVNIQPTIIGNQIEIANIGINAINNRGLIDVKGNTITNVTRGVYLQQNPLANSIISGNTISASLDASGVMWGPAGIALTDPTRVRNTIIEDNIIKDFANGISCLNLLAGSISDNDISFNEDVWPFFGFDFHRGITILNSGVFNLTENTILNNSNATSGFWKQLLTGIKISNSISPFLCSNHTTLFHKGICMDGPMPGSRLKLNEMTSNNYGFMLNWNGEIGQQGDFLNQEASWNKWISSTILDTWSDNGSNPNNTSFFDVTSPITTGAGLFPALPVLGRLVTDNSTATCAGTGWNLNAQARNAIILLNSDTVSSEEQVWFLKQAYYEWILSDTSIDQSDSVISAFIDTVFSEPIGIEHRISSLIAQAYVDSLEFPDSDLLDSAQVLNSTIDTAFHIDENLRKVNNIFFNVFTPTVDTLSSTDSTYLVELAMSCPHYEGPAVYQAIAMLEINGDTSVYRGDTLCSTDTCSTILAAPDSIEGWLSGVCGSTGESYTLTTPVTGADKYKWTVSDTSLATVIQPDSLSGVTIDFSDSVSVVMLTATAINSCGSTSRSILIYGGPKSPGTIDGSQSVCSGGVENYTIGGSHGATYYEWIVPAGSTILGGQGSNEIIVLFGSTIGNISVIAMNDCDTSTVDSLDIIVSSCRQSQEVYQLSGVRAYPNPSTGIFTIRFYSNEKAPYSLTIADFAGKVTCLEHSSSMEGINLKEVDLSEYAKGIYFLHFNTSACVEILKIVIE